MGPSNTSFMTKDGTRYENDGFVHFLVFAASNDGVGRQKPGLVVTQSHHQAGCAGTDLQRSGLGDPEM